MSSIAEARSRLINAKGVEEKAQADAELSNALSRLLVIVERYPDLKTNEHFTRLIDELAGTENRIAVARKNYNEAVRDYNIKLKTFPSVIVARLMGFQEAKYFKADAKAYQTPKVDFSN